MPNVRGPVVPVLAVSPAALGSPAAGNNRGGGSGAWMPGQAHAAVARDFAELRKGKLALAHAYRELDRFVLTWLAWVNAFQRVDRGV